MSGRPSLLEPTNVGCYTIAEDAPPHPGLLPRGGEGESFPAAYANRMLDGIGIQFMTSRQAKNTVGFTKKNCRSVRHDDKVRRHDTLMKSEAIQTY